MDEATKVKPLPALIPTGKVAEMFGVNLTTVRNWERDGKITAIRTPGGQRRFRRSDVEALLTNEVA